MRAVRGAVVARDLTIREVRADEIPALAALATAVYAAAFGRSMSMEDLETQLRNTRSENYFRSAIVKDTILVAIREGAIAGYAQLCDVRVPVAGATSADRELHALYVDTRLQGQGIGGALIDAAFVRSRFTSATGSRRPGIATSPWAASSSAATS